MLREVQTLTQYPYSATVHLIVTFPDGAQARGTAALVGRNDVLTAIHVLYNPDHGGWADDIDFYFGVDYNARLGRLESTSLYEMDAYQWEVVGWPGLAYQDFDNETMTLNEIQGDLALIGLDHAVGDYLGWFGLSPGYDSPMWAYQLGYPSGSSGLMEGQALLSKPGGYDVYSAYSWQGSDIMGSGSSGGPLYVMDNGQATLIGVKSAGTEVTSYWADIGYLYDQLTQLISENDVMLGERTQLGGDGNDALYASSVAERFDGGAGIDTVIYQQAFGNYRVTVGETYTRVSNLRNSSDTDTLSNIERLHFSDGTLALDVGAGEAAGSVYRLYQAAFNRTPDDGGLRYWIGVMDDGLSLNAVANYFSESAEFSRLYGSDPGDAEMVTLLYNNVLGRAPDAGGQAYWLQVLEQGVAYSDVLVYFSESQENQIRMQGVIDDGIWLQGQFV